MEEFRESFSKCVRCCSRACRVSALASLSSLFSSLTVSSSRCTCRALTANFSSSLAMRPVSCSILCRCAAFAAATCRWTRSSSTSIIS
jgi:hypothetical protein